MSTRSAFWTYNKYVFVPRLFVRPTVPAHLTPESLPQLSNVGGTKLHRLMIDLSRVTPESSVRAANFAEEVLMSEPLAARVSIVSNDPALLTAIRQLPLTKRVSVFKDTDAAYAERNGWTEWPRASA